MHARVCCACVMCMHMHMHMHIHMHMLMHMHMHMPHAHAQAARELSVRAPVAAPPAAPTPPAGVRIDADGRARDADAPAAPPAAGRPVSMDLVEAR